MAAYHEARARGGAGLIITGIVHVHDFGQTSPIQNSVVDDHCIPGLKKLSAAAHNLGTKIAIQLFHAGRESARFLDAKKMASQGFRDWNRVEEWLQNI